MTEYKKMDEKDLQKTLSDKRNTLRSFKFGVAGSKTRNVKEGRGVRKDIARILTELRTRKSDAVTNKSSVKAENKE